MTESVVGADADHGVLRAHDGKARRRHRALTPVVTDLQNIDVTNRAAARERVKDVSFSVSGQHGPKCGPTHHHNDARVVV